MDSTTTKSVVLGEDPIHVPGQRFALFSFVGPSANQPFDKWAIKIRGVFNTKEEADAHVKRLIREDPHFDVYVVDMYRWLMFPPNNDQIEDVVYQEKFLNDLFQGYRENQKQAKEFFELRKRNVMEEGIDKHLLPEEKLPAPSPQELLEEMADTPSTSAS